MLARKPELALSTIHSLTSLICNVCPLGFGARSRLYIRMNDLLQTGSEKLEPADQTPMQTSVNEQIATKFKSSGSPGRGGGEQHPGECPLTLLCSNTAHAHELGGSRDWVVISYYDDHYPVGQAKAGQSYVGVTLPLGRWKGRLVLLAPAQLSCSSYQNLPDRSVLTNSR
jgi:hypothetical protein